MCASALDSEPARERFVMHGQIGRGAMGEVFRVLDRELGCEVALKMLRDPEPDKIVRFKREFRALADVVHPNLVRLHELVSHRDQWFFTMELVDGVDFLTWVRGDGPLVPEPPDLVDPTVPVEGPPVDNWPTMTVEGQSSPTERALRGAPPRSPLPRPGPQSAPLVGDDRWQRLREGLRQLAAAVQALHDHRTLHRDLKPSNVLVARDGRVVVLDFGIATQLSRGSSPNQLAGTPAYMAPEVGVRPTLDEASDWYALGVMMYEAMAGRRPFVASVADLISLKRQRDAPSVRELAIEPPDDLASLCDALLAREPAMRPTGGEVLARLGARATVGAAPRALREHDLVGRASHLAALRGAYQAVLGGDLRVVLVTGPSGAGKSTLVSHFLADIAAGGAAAVVAGRCYERESVPFKAVDDLVDDMCQQLAALPTPEVAGLLPRRVGALARLFPGLEQIEAVRGAPRVVGDSDPHVQRRAAFQALRELMDRLTARRPVVLHIDDGQWGDDDSAALLAEVFRAPLAPPVLLVVSYRRTDDMGRFVDEVRAIDPAVVEITVGDLDPDAARELAERLLVEAGGSPALAEGVARESGGNPLFVGELVGHVARGAGTAAALRLDDLVRARVAELPAPARRLIELLAVAAWSVPRRLALAAADVAGEVDAIDALLAARLLAVRRGRAGDAVETIHDRMRAAIVGGLSAAEVTAAHRRLADALAGDEASHLDHLAVHLDLAGDRVAAGACYQRAADAANAVLAFERAGRLYARAIELLEPTGAARADLHRRLAEACQNAGQGAAAAGAYLVAAGEVGRIDALRYRGQAAQQFLRAGHVDQGVAALAEVLAEVGIAMPRTRARAIVSLIALRARIRFGRLRFLERSTDQVPSEELTTLDTCWTAAVAIGMCDTVVGAVFQARHLLEALRAGDAHHVIHALSIEAGYRSLPGIGGRRAVEAIAVRARDLADRHGAPMDIAWSHGCHAFARYQLGEFRLAREAADASLAAMEGRAGIWFERATAEMYRLWALYWLGDFHALAERSIALRAQAIDLGDLYSATNLSIGLPSAHWLVRGQAAEGRRAAEDAMQRWRHRRYHLQHYWYAYAISHVDLYEGKAPAAWHRLRQTWKDVGTALLRNVQMVRVELLWARGRAAIAAAGEQPGRRKELLADASWCARRLRGEKRPDAHALSLALEAGLCAARGDRDGAIPLLTATADRASERELGFVAAVARLVRGRLVGGERGAQLVRDAEAWMSGQGVADPSALARVFMPGVA